jgi:thioredoxin reductase
MPIGGVITTTNLVENYPGFASISGYDLAQALKDHAAGYKNVTPKEEKVEEIKKSENIFYVKSNKREYVAKAIIFATGTRWKKLNIPGSKEFENRGVAYCALCDAPLFKNKTVAVIGGSDSAAKDALVLAEYAKKVYIIYRGESIRAEPINMQKIKNNKKIEIINNTNLTSIIGSRFVESANIDQAYKGKKELNIDGVFVAIGHEAISEIAQNIGVKINEKKEIIIDHRTSRTNVPRIYAAGDVTDKPFKQAITGVAQGCTAAYSAYEDISGKSL